MSKRGYCGIGVYHPKTEANIGTLWRSAHAFGADFIFTVGPRYKRQASDTTYAERSLPLLEFETIDDLIAHLPKGCRLIPVEVNGRYDLPLLSHPDQAAYLLGPEDGSLPESVLQRWPISVRIDTDFCLNVATAGSLVLYDRHAKTALRNHGVRL